MSCVMSSYLGLLVKSPRLQCTIEATIRIAGLSLLWSTSLRKRFTYPQIDIHAESRIRTSDLSVFERSKSVGDWAKLPI
jgi:hypothetical protein